MNVVISQTLVVPSGCSSPDLCGEHLSRIADLEDRLSSVKTDLGCHGPSRKILEFIKETIFSGGADVYLGG
jgi:hypothetical protein